MKRFGCNVLTSGALLAMLACSGSDATQLLEERSELGYSVPAAPAEPPPLAVQPGPAAELPASSMGSPVEPPAAAAGPAGPPESIFERSHRVEVQIEMSAEDWEVSRAEGIGLREILFPASGFREVPPYTRFTASVTVDGVRYENVSVRKKGYIGSLSVIRPSLKLDFERNLGVELASGMRNMTLNNDLQDPTHVKQCLSYDLFAAIGVPAPRCNFAHVVVNGVDLGTYTHLEDVAKPMLARHFADNDGNLYEGTLADFDAERLQYLELETNEAANDRSDAEAVSAALASSDDQVVAALGRVIDLDNFFDFWALETLLGHWDGYASFSNNYFAYHDPSSDKFFFIPWGTDQTFIGDNPNDAITYDVAVYAAGSIANRLYAVPSTRARYRDRMSQLNDELWNVPELLARVDDLSRLVPNPSRPDLVRLRSYIQEHGDALRARLQQPAPEWPETPPPEPPIDACVGSAGALSGTFSTEWGDIENLAELTAAPSEFDTSVEIDGSPFTATFRGRGGESSPNTATLRMLGPRSDGWYVLISLNMPLELFVPGRHPLHAFESLGEFGMFHPQFGDYQIGVIGDGAVQLDRASLQPGGAISGRFDGIVNYYACMDTFLGYFPSAESLPPPTEEPAPDEPAPDEPAPDEPAPDEPAPDEPAPEEPAGGELSRRVDG